ncbi:MAG TPA: DnaJ domain-containing protein [Bacteroidia bacterium]|jgi:curved DNA-binding protein CbpA
MSERNYYILLEIKTTATAEEIKAAYRQLAKKYHPDKNTGNKAAEEYFKEIQQAYAILSNPEKRRKYDLRFSQVYKTQVKQKAYSNAPYTGNAYQYAQQQAQARPKPKASPQPQQTAAKPDNTESWQILVSVGIAMVLLYFIISYSADKPKKNPPAKEPATEIKTAEQESLASLDNFSDSPYTVFFGEKVFDTENGNTIRINNKSSTPAVVCLVNNTPPKKTLRNYYIPGETVFTMNAIPDGDYFLRVYYGNDWDPEKAFPFTGVKGGFKIEQGYREQNTGKDLLHFKKSHSKDPETVREIIIDADNHENSWSISPEEFFRKE